MRRRIAALGCVLAVAGCAGSGVVHVTVEGAEPVEAVDRLEVVAVHDGATARAFFLPPRRPALLGRETFNLVLASDQIGRAHV